MRNIDSLQKALDTIPSDDRDIWLKVLAALKHEAIIGEMDEKTAFSMAIDWSKKSSKFKQPDFFKVWKSLGDKPKELATCGVIYEEAKKHGYVKDAAGSGMPSAIALNQFVSVRDNTPAQSVPSTMESRVNAIKTYLRAIYSDTDKINIVLDSELTEKGKFIPTGKGNTMAVSAWIEIIDQSVKINQTAFGLLGFGVESDGTKYSYNHNAGAWIRLNPLDGGGIRDENVESYKYALVESDNMDKTSQLEAIKRLHLPIKAVIDSGGKSIHAIVKVDAKSAGDYAIKVRYLYDVCKKYGLDLDYQDSNPSRLYRLPGILRGNQTQHAIKIFSDNAVQGFEEWQNSLELGLPVDICDDWDEFDPEKELAPVVIEGILRQGHKMLVGGPSKAGKSMALIELAAALVTGSKWLGHQCKKSHVLYLNMEIDKASFKHRVHRVFNALKLRPSPGYLSIWNLRGLPANIKKMVDSAISVAAREQYDVIIVDPIYKLMTGDENKAGDIGQLCLAFDKLAAATGASIVYSHHFAKGKAYGNALKNVADRVSGSGVFGRDADAILSLNQLHYNPPVAMPGEAPLTAWRVESILREFPPAVVTNVFFDYPLHRLDTEGILKEAKWEGDRAAESGEARGEQQTAEKEDRKERLFEYLRMHLGTKTGGVDEIIEGREALLAKKVAHEFDLSNATLTRYLSETDEFERKSIGKIGYIFMNR